MLLFYQTLAKYNILDQAKAAFEGIQEEAGNVPDVMLNLAHTLLQMNEHEQAVQLYRKVLETCTPFNRQVQVMMMLARALYERAITKAVEVNNVDRTAAIRDCIATLRKAIHLCPADPVIRCAHLVPARAIPRAPAHASTPMLLCSFTQVQPRRCAL